MDPRFYDLGRLFRFRDALARLDPSTAPTLQVVVPETGQPAPDRLAVLPGSFNPLTIAHTALAEAAQRRLDCPALFVLSRLTIDKERVTGAALEDRLLVLDLYARHAAERRSDSTVWVGVTNRGLYVEQAEAIRAAFSAVNDLVFLVGFDKIVQIFDPRYYADRDAALRRLFELASFKVAPRGDGEPEEIAELLDRPENRRFAGRVAPLVFPDDLREIAASSVRAAVGAGLPWEPALPEEAAAFIAETGAYAPSRRLSSGEVVDEYGVRIRLLDLLDRSRPWAESEADFAALLRAARSDTEIGRDLRRWLGNAGPGAASSTHTIEP